MTLLRLLLAASIIVAAPLGAVVPVAPVLEKAAAAMPAGGIVHAEIEGDRVTYGATGRLGAPAGVAPERVVFEIGSITKVFTGLLLAQAALEGKVGLDDPIAKHLPADLALDPAVAAITLAQLASHTSGLPRLPDNLAPADPGDPYADYTEERLFDFLRRHRPSGPAPDAGDYSNLGFGLLGHILVRVEGVGFEELVRRRITGPLGMDDTVVALDSDRRSRLATPHSGTTAVSLWGLGALPGAGALRSTAADLAKFVQALLDDRSPLAPAWRLVREPRARMGRSGQVGLGVFLSRRGEDVVYSHGGGTGGFRTHLELTPATRSGTVVLVNNDSPDPGPLVAETRRPAPAAAPAAAAPREVALSPTDAAAFTGVYEIDARGRFTVVQDESGGLRVRLTGQPFLPVGYQGDDRFFSRAVAAQFQFARGADGRVDRLTLHQNGRELPARRTGNADPVLFPAPEVLRQYEGVYELAPGAVFEVRLGARTPVLTVKLTGQPALPVHNTRPDHFVYDVVEAALTFERDPAGRVVALVLHQHGRDQRAPRRADP